MTPGFARRTVRAEGHRFDDRLYCDREGCIWNWHAHQLYGRPCQGGASPSNLNKGRRTPPGRLWKKRKSFIPIHLRK